MKNTRLISDQIQNFGYGTITYSKDLKTQIQKLAFLFKSFCDQSLNHKLLIPFEESGGYEYKTKEDSLDAKEDFHITKEYSFPLILNPNMKDDAFVSFAKNILGEKELFEMLKEISSHFLRMTVKNFPKYALDPNGWVLRFLHYFAQDGDLAYQHFDKGGHTLHLYESAPGLECFWKDNWNPISFSENEAVFFPGGLAQLVSQCELKALWHRVVATEESAKIGRYSMVLFNDYPKYLYTYNKEKFGPVQKAFNLGENYLMTPSKFIEYFTERKIMLDAR